MKSVRFSRVLSLALAAALCLTLSACKSKDEQAAASSTSNSAAQSVMQPIQPEEIPLDEILPILAQNGLEELEDKTALEAVSYEEILSDSKDNSKMVVLSVSGLPHVSGLNNLVAGIWDETSNTAMGEIFTLRGDHPLHAYWKDEENRYHILLANTSSNNGYETGSHLLYLTWDGSEFNQITKLPSHFLYDGEPLPTGWQSCLLNGDPDFWENLKAVPYPGGMELYIRNSEYNPSVPSESQPRPWLYTGYIALDGNPLPEK